MSGINKKFSILACLYLLSGVQLGALGSHALSDVLTPQKLASWELAVQYQLIHAIGIILISLLATQIKSQKLLSLCNWLLAIGVVLFSGSIYAMALGAPSWLGMVAPLGGSAFMLAWLLAGIAVWKA
jgi:uncharacterized membrane protein YgdD (TMEM256/DUF423 family)